MSSNPRWWGWGTMDRGYPRGKAQQSVEFLRKELGISLQEWAPPRLEDLNVPESRLAGALTDRLGAETVQTSRLERVSRCCGKSYRDLLRVRSGQLPPLPEAVLTPHTAQEIGTILKVARELEVAVVPFGGGTSVVGGVEGPSDKPFVTLDMRHLNRCLDFDSIAKTATFEAGIFGPQLEAVLQSRGCLLGHFPQSFEYSTLGGWVATRSAGQNSTKYGKIEELVESVTVECPGGTYRSLRVPACASGPDLLRVMVGSEGLLGVITDVTVKIHALPGGRIWRAIFFPEFEAGVDALRRMVQADIWPSVCRLSDPVETNVSLGLQVPPRGLRPGELLKRMVIGRLRGFPRGAMLILCFEGSRRPARQEWMRALRILRRAGGRNLGPAPARAWERQRFETPYLRDDLMSARIMVETLETSTVWSNLMPLYWKLRTAIEDSLGGRGRVATHLSHLYPNGASLYVTFMAPMEGGRELEQWERAKVAATEAICSMGATLSHHHGIGADHARWAEREHGPLGVGMLRALKREMDPSGILNPGKVFL